MRTFHIVPVALVLVLLASQTTAFQVFQPGFQVATFTSRKAAVTQLSAKKRKRGKLGDVDISREVSKTTQTPKRSATPVPVKKTTGTVSPALAEWAASSTVTSTTDVSTLTTSVEDEAPSADINAPFEEEEEEETTTTTTTTRKSSRRVKQSARKEEQKERDATISRIVDNINEVLEEKSNNLDDILNAIRPLLTCESGNLRQLTMGKTYNYRLAWVGGDDALCHIGTGLHKVPLARMQEVFLICQGKGRIEILEVIRILGPFPNVRNTIQGNSKVNRIDETTEWSIVYDSMIDGTGKEISAGTDDNIRRVKLQVYFADPYAILAVVPPEAGVRDDPLENNGVNVLLFVREDDLDAKLDKMRVA